MERIAQTDKSGWGFLSMQERAAACGGELQIESVIGEGTTVTVRVPVA